MAKNIWPEVHNNPCTRSFQKTNPFIIPTNLLHIPAKSIPVIPKRIYAPFFLSKLSFKRKILLAIKGIKTKERNIMAIPVTIKEEDGILLYQTIPFKL